jgi:PAS domain S-box-containing protein
MSAKSVDELLVGGGEMGDMIRAADWAKTPLGPITAWPRTLLSYASLILEMPSPAIIFWGPEQTQIYNEGYSVIMGPRHPEYLGASYRACWPDTYPLIYPWMRKVLDHGEVIRVENEHIPLTRYGFDEEAFFTFSFSPLRDDEGVIRGIFQPVFEITSTVLSDRRAATLRALARCADSHNTMRDLVEVLSSNDRDIPFALLYLTDSTGTKLQLVGRTTSLSALEAGVSRFAKAAQETFQHNAPREIDARTLLDGAAVGAWPEPIGAAIALPIRRSRSDDPRGVVVFGISPRLHFDDSYRRFFELAARQVAAAVTRMRARREAEWQRRSLERLFMQAPAAIALLHGPDHVFRFCNPLYRRLIGERQVIGKPIREALPELEDQQFFTILDRVYRTREAHVGVETPIRLASADEVILNYVYQPMIDEEGGVEGILVFAFDVSEQVNARRREAQLTDELKQEHKRKDEFLAMLAHELRNPLAAITNVAHLLGASDISGDMPEQIIKVLQRQTGVLKDLVDDLLDVSRITRGLVELKRERVDLRTLITHALESVQARMDERHHDVHVALPDQAVPVAGDGIRLEQVLVNVLTNAAKYTDPGGRIQISLAMRDRTAELRVRDNGIGMSRAVLERIFTLFGQAERGLDRSDGGLGIGLTIARNLVELHGGTIDAFSDGPGKGSEFVITLPLLEAATESSATTASPPDVQAAPRRVLVIEDNRDIADTLAVLLREAGHHVEVAFDGPSALATIDTFVPELVLVDIGLPDMNGYEVAEHLRRTPATASALIIAVTGYGQTQDREKAKAAGFDAHFVKPIDFAALEAFIARSLAAIPS